MAATDALAYEEPSIVTILTLASFLLLLNGINYALDRIVYCGLIGQILVGVAWGTPGAKWLSQDVQDSVMQLGYLGLILIVYEGGLSTNLRILRANLALSASVALVGIATPIALSFILLKMLPITPLQAFAAGAALCSTSLGTTFTVLQTSGLTTSRLGVVLASAAMMDDVVGLIMVQVISNLGDDSAFQAHTVVRPIGVSLAFAICVPLICAYAVNPMASHLRTFMRRGTHEKLRASIASHEVALACHTAVLLALVTGSSYAGTSNLFAAYIAGASVTWFDATQQDVSNESTLDSSTASRPRTPLVADPSSPATGSSSSATPPPPAPSQTSKPPSKTEKSPSKGKVIATGTAIYERYYAPAVNTLLKPFFFASIGFSIPITQMFHGSILWRGFIYTALMVLGKTVCGLCLVRCDVPSARRLWQTNSDQSGKKPANQPGRNAPTQQQQEQSGGGGAAKANTAKKRSTHLPKPRSLYPAAILGSAMVARGEIGFLISSVAQSNGIYSVDGGGSSALFLTVTWAILLCTVLGPVTVGLLVRRVRRLQLLERQRKTGKEDPLGIWGVVGN
ncbi:Sodium/hydrogen exchanger [Teratosphaeria destructans]|uniref:Sodium/hydrogen exchanger n=1 Tax=Teratosphaeria destructans TaxID=418781 RepID=A0A9W7SNP1_9PEZI|nr:Sodium/hydrogen exchanger [Teratosphaeria destructans]